MRRKIFTFLCALILCIAVLSVSVYADSITFKLENFLVSSTFNGTAYTYRYFMRANDSGKFILTSNGNPVSSFNGKSFGLNVGLFNLNVDDYLSMIYYPYGESNYITIGSDDANGARLRSGSLKWDQTNRTSGLSVVIGSEQVRIFFYDKFYNQLSIWDGDPDIDSISVPGKAVYFNIQYHTTFLITAQTVSCTADNITLTNIVSATLQEGILGPAGEYIPPSNGSAIGDLDDVENGLLGGLDSVKDSISDLASTAISQLSSLISSFGFISHLISSFFKLNKWSLPIFYVSLTVGIFALLVNVSASFVGGKNHD